MWLASPNGFVVLEFLGEGRLKLTKVHSENRKPRASSARDPAPSWWVSGGKRGYSSKAEGSFCLSMLILVLVRQKMVLIKKTLISMKYQNIWVCSCV